MHSDGPGLAFQSDCCNWATVKLILWKLKHRCLGLFKANLRDKHTTRSVNTNRHQQQHNVLRSSPNKQLFSSAAGLIEWNLTIFFLQHIGSQLIWKLLIRMRLNESYSEAGWSRKPKTKITKIEPRKHTNCSKAEGGDIQCRHLQAFRISAFFASRAGFATGFEFMTRLGSSTTQFRSQMIRAMENVTSSRLRVDFFTINVSAAIERVSGGLLSTLKKWQIE